MTARQQRDHILIDPSADVACTAIVGAGSRIWHLAQVCEGGRLGRCCVLGRGAYVGPDVVVGDFTKIQNYALVYAPAHLEAGVFVGPAAVLTNDLHPRAVGPDGLPKSATGWSPVGVHVREGASLGARCVCVAPITIGRWAMVGAGAVVVADVPDFALVVGVPARRIGWVGRTGKPLVPRPEHRWLCEDTGAEFLEQEGTLHELGS